MARRTGVTIIGDWKPTAGAQRTTSTCDALLASQPPHVLWGDRLIPASGSGCRYLSPREAAERRQREREQLARDCR